MKSKVFAFVLGLLFLQLAQAVTIWYQPTPYPMKKGNGTPMDTSVVVKHVMNGYTSTYFPNNPLAQTEALDLFKNQFQSYNVFVKFDLTGLPNSVTSAGLFMYPFSGTPSQPYIDVYKISGPLEATTSWNTRPAMIRLGWLYQPVFGQWYGMDITNDYNGWRATQATNHGYMFDIPATNGAYETLFRNTLYSDYVNDPFADGKRPSLQLSFQESLSLKMPLPGGYKWLVTNEIGGYECMGGIPWPDVAHQDSGANGNYYSIDFAWNNSGSTYGKYNTPVLAAAAGKVIEVGGGNNPGDYNGFYVVIDHDSDGNLGTGFQTRYLHLKQSAAKANGVLLAVGNSVYQGDQIGIMGTTGKNPDGTSTSTDVHLHFGVRYQNHGYSYTPELSKVVMEGLILKSYQTECSVNSSGVPVSRIRYYNSTTVLTGN